MFAKNIKYLLLSYWTMTKENLLQKVRRSLANQKVTLFRAWERNSYVQGAADYGYSFEIVPKKGIYQIDTKTKASLITLRNNVFKELLSKQYEDREEDFEGIRHVSW